MAIDRNAILLGSRQMHHSQGALCALLLLLLFCSCSSNSPSDSDNPDEIIGWRSAGINWPDAENTGGVTQLKAVGNYLFAMDCYTPMADSSGIRSKQWKLWINHLGSEEWVQLHLPDSSAVPYEMVTSNSYLFVTSLNPGGIWRFDPDKAEWTNIIKAGKTPIPENLSNFSIGFIGIYKGNLATSIWSKDTLLCWISDLDGNNGKQIPCPGKKNSIASMEMQELNGSLYGISPYYGIFRYTEGASSWDSLPSARGRKETEIVDACKDLHLGSLVGVDNASCPQEQSTGEIEGVASITAHDGHIIIGYKYNESHDNGIFRLEKNDTWTNLTPKYIYQDSVAISDAMTTTEALLSYNGWLIAGGANWSFPRFWKPLDTAKPQFGDWKIVYEKWNEIAGGYFEGVKTSDIVGVGDTLYAAAWTTILKIPIAEINNLLEYKYEDIAYPHLQDSLSMDSTVKK